MRQRESSSLIDSCGDFVIRTLVKYLDPMYVYHGIYHTLEVVQNSKVIGFNSNLTPDEYENLIIAAWFHDTGFVEINKGHEEVSAKLALKFLADYEISDDSLVAIKNAILRTNIELDPVEKIDMVLRDADLAHLGKEDFVVKQELLRIEWENSLGQTYTDYEWAKSNYNFLTWHKYYTEYAIKFYQPEKQANIDSFMMQIQLYEKSKNN